jgi:hypothetical protein
LLKSRYQLQLMIASGGIARQIHLRLPSFQKSEISK